MVSSSLASDYYMIESSVVIHVQRVCVLACAYEAGRNVLSFVIDTTGFNVHIFVVNSNRCSIMYPFYVNMNVAVTT
jgi:hypothetical protein